MAYTKEDYHEKKIKQAAIQSVEDERFQLVGQAIQLRDGVTDEMIQDTYDGKDPLDQTIQTQQRRSIEDHLYHLLITNQHLSNTSQDLVLDTFIEVKISFYIQYVLNIQKKQKRFSIFYILHSRLFIFFKHSYMV